MCKNVYALDRTIQYVTSLLLLEFRIGVNVTTILNTSLKDMFHPYNYLQWWAKRNEWPYYHEDIESNIIFKKREDFVLFMNYINDITIDSSLKRKRPNFTSLQFYIPCQSNVQFGVGIHINGENFYELLHGYDPFDIEDTKCGSDYVEVVHKKYVNERNQKRWKQFPRIISQQEFFTKFMDMINTFIKM